MSKEAFIYGPKIAILLANQYDFDTLLMAAILAAKDDQTSLYLIAGFRDLADQLMQSTRNDLPENKATEKG